MTQPSGSALWDLEAGTFDNAADHGLTDAATRQAWRGLLLSHLPPPQARVADLGCGTGTLSVLLAQEGYRVDGVDFSSEMIRRAETKAADVAGVTFAVGDAAAPRLPSGEYDVVLCRHVLWALPDPAAALDRWVELLAPDGRVVLVEGRWWSGGGLTAEETLRLVRGCGRTAELVPLDDPTLWGQPVDDERYLVVS